MTNDVGLFDDDPIFVVTGVRRDEILDRCVLIRACGTGAAFAARSTERTRDAVRLLDLADVSAGDFVETAHRVVLGRSPSPAERVRRLEELEQSVSRLGIVLRLALAPEGRRATHPVVGGVALPVLFSAGRVIEAASRTPALAQTVRFIERAARRTFVSGRRSGDDV